MELNVNIAITRYEAKVKLANSNVLSLHAFGVLIIYAGDEAFNTIRGFTIRTKTFGDKEVLSVVPPAYPSGNKLQCSYFTHDKNLWKQIIKLFLDEYSQLSGGLRADESLDDLELDRIAEEIDQQQERGDKSTL